MPKNRIPRQHRASRRADHSLGTRVVELIVQRQQYHRMMLRAAGDTQAALDRMAARERTLLYDESAKAHTPSQAKVLENAAIWNEHTEIEEDKAAYLIPRMSLGRQQMLALFPITMEFRETLERQLDQVSRDTLAKIAKQVKRCHPTNRKALAAKLMVGFTPTFTIWHGEPSELLWKSDTTLLNRRKGFDTFDRIAFKRQTSRTTKERRIEKEEDIDYSELNKAIKAENAIRPPKETDQ